MAAKRLTMRQKGVKGLLKDFIWAIQNLKHGGNTVVRTHWKGRKSVTPTMGTLIPHTFRAFHMALVWKMSCHPRPALPPPTEYYRKTIDAGIKPIMCTNPPAPHALVELRKCGCAANSKPCARRTCTCLKNWLTCADMCTCGELCCNRQNEAAGKYE